METSSNSAQQPSLLSSPYPFADAPDIIRAHQKDASFQSALAEQLSDLHRRFLGPRSAHLWSKEASTAADLLYFGLTTFLGNRTLGEEYCGLVQVEDGKAGLAAALRPARSAPRGGPRLPGVSRRSAFILTSILLPYLISRLLPRFRARARQVLEGRLAALLKRRRDERRKSSSSSEKSLATRAADFSSRVASSLCAYEYATERYILLHLSSLTSGTYLRALALAIFYFDGAHYTFAKRITGLRYVFTTRREPADGAGGGTGAGGQAGYEVLGAMLAIQLAVQGYQHVQATMTGNDGTVGGGMDPDLAEQAAELDERIRQRAFGDTPKHEIDDGEEDTELLRSESPHKGSHHHPQTKLSLLATMSHTPLPPPPPPLPSQQSIYATSTTPARYDLRRGPGVMAWIKGDQQRKCTLCLEELKDPSATPCGHVFCWTCIGDWIRERPECPLCRREAMVQHVLPLRTV